MPALRAGSRKIAARVDRIGYENEHDRHGACCASQWLDSSAARREDDVRCKGHQFRRASINFIACGPTVVDLDVLSDGPTQLLQTLQKCRVSVLRLGIIRAVRHEHGHAPHGFGLALRVRGDPHAVADPTIALTKSRRRIAFPKAQDHANYAITAGICDGRNGGRGSVCAAAIPSCSCPLWVKSGHSVRSRQCPLYPQKRTLIERFGMSALCQKRTPAIRSTRRRAVAVHAKS